MTKLNRGFALAGRPRVASVVAGPSLPGAPTSLVVTTSGIYLQLNWTAPASSGTGSITAYAVYRGSTSGSETLLVVQESTVTNLTDEGVTDGDTYYYKVAAVTAIGTGPQSNEAYGTASSGSSWPYTASTSPDQIGTAPSPWTAGTSIFTTLVPASPTLASNSATMVANLNSQISANGGVDLNTDSWTPTRYVVHGNTVPHVTVYVNPSWLPTYDDTPVGTISVPIPVGAVADPYGGDHQMVVIDVDNQIVWEFWAMFPPGTYTGSGEDYWACATFTVGPLAPSSEFYGVFPYPAAWPWPGTNVGNGVQDSASASRISYAGGLITVADVISRSINHALNFALPYTGNYVAPALFYDGETSSNSVPEGSWFYFPSTVAMPSGLSLIAQLAFTAIQKYGMYIMDTSGSVNAYIENSSGWAAYGTFPIADDQNNDGGVDGGDLGSLPWADIKCLAPASQAAIVGGAS